MNRRNFLRLGSLFVPVVVAPTVAYSFLWARPESYVWESTVDDRRRVQHSGMTLYYNGERIEIDPGSLRFHFEEPPRTLAIRGGVVTVTSKHAGPFL
jgi:hypothetical protein